MEKDNFLSNIMNFGCNIVDFEKDKDLNKLDQIKFAYSKTDVATKYSILAKKNDFYLADVTVKLQKIVSNRTELLDKNDEVKIANFKLKESIINLAEGNFIYDRFHNDPNISNEIALKIKGQWIENYFIGERGDNCFVILENETKAKGFLLTLIRKNEVVIDLIAVDKKFRKKGIASKLIKGMINYYRKDYSTYSVGTQISNIPSINLYEKCGFNIIEYGLVWHYFNIKRIK